MNRRSFFKSLGVITAATVFIPKSLDHFQWKKARKSGIWVPNPDYVNAPYEVAIAKVGSQEWEWQVIIYKRGENFEIPAPTHELRIIRDQMPIRFGTDVSKNPIPPFIEL